MKIFVPSIKKNVLPLIFLNRKVFPNVFVAASLNRMKVLYGEMLNASFLKAVNYIGHADTLLVVGTSLEPAAGLLKRFTGKNLVIINREKTPYDASATLVIHKELKDVFAKLV